MSELVKQNPILQQYIPKPTQGFKTFGYTQGAENLETQQEAKASLDTELAEVKISEEALQAAKKTLGERVVTHNEKVAERTKKESEKAKLQGEVDSLKSTLNSLQGQLASARQAVEEAQRALQEAQRRAAEEAARLEAQRQAAYAQPSYVQPSYVQPQMTFDMPTQRVDFAPPQPDLNALKSLDDVYKRNIEAIQSYAKPAPIPQPTPQQTVSPGAIKISVDNIKKLLSKWL